MKCKEDYKWKKGDRVTVRENCSSCIKGVTYTLATTNKGPLIAWRDGFQKGEGCTCHWNWVPVNVNRDTNLSDTITEVVNELKNL